MITTAFMPGRFAPPHKGQINALFWLLSKFDKLIVGIGSCYEVGRPRHPMLAIFREKMILWSLVNEKIDPARVSFVHLQDYDDWNRWWENILSIAANKQVTHFVTGNQADILDVISEKGIALPFKLVNPEIEMPLRYQFPHHSTDLREAIARGDYQAFEAIAASGTISLMGNVGGFAGVRSALNDTAPKIVPGRQAVDLIITCGYSGLVYVLTGYRKKSKENFPGCLAIPGGAIETHESPMDAAVRELREETGLTVRIVKRYLEPAHVMVDNVISEMRFVGLFGTKDVRWGGTQGGSSQVFHIRLDTDPENLEKYLRSDSDLTEVAFRPIGQVRRAKLAYQQNKMLERALNL